MDKTGNIMTYERAGETDEWYTPKYIFDAIGIQFDIDVASPTDGPRYTPCHSFISQNSLEEEWKGTVWMNPPFGNQKTKKLWLSKFFAHGNGVALIPDRTSASWWQEYANLAEVIVFVAPKVKFERPDGSLGKNPSTGTCLFSVGKVPNKALLQCNLGLTISKMVEVD
jgi:hypothetical protein